MPPDVILALASSGITLVASLLFFVSDEHPPRAREEGTGEAVEFCVPPPRLAAGAGAPTTSPPPLPAAPECRVDVGPSGSLSFRPAGDEWVVTFDSVPLSDAPAVQLRGHDVVGVVHDLRWHGRAGVLKPTHVSWKQKPGRA